MHGNGMASEQLSAQAHRGLDVLLQRQAEATLHDTSPPQVEIAEQMQAIRQGLQDRITALEQAISGATRAARGDASDTISLHTDFASAASAGDTPQGAMTPNL